MKIKSFKSKDIIFLLTLFLISFATHFIVCQSIPYDFKTAGMIPDEFGFINLSNQIYNGEELTNSMGAHSSKYLYSLLLAPSNLFVDLKSKILFINILNCFIVSLIVIPSFLLFREIFKENKYTYIATTLSAFTPSTFYCIGYMAEVLSVPITMFFIYLIYLVVNREQTGSLIYVLIGLTGCLMYLTKEHLLAYCITAFILLCVVEKHKVNLLKYVIPFTLLYVFMNLVIFKEVIPSNPYSVQIANAVNAIEALSIEQLAGYPLALVTHTLMATLFIPVIVIVHDHKDKFNLFLFSTYALIVLQVVLGAMYLEDTGQPRIMMRYFYPLLFVIFMYSLGKIKDGLVFDIKNVKFIFTVLVISVLTITLSSFYDKIDNEVGILNLTNQLDGFLVNLLVTVAILTIIIFFSKKRSLNMIMSIFCFIVLSSSLVFCLEFRANHENSDETITNVTNIENTIGNSRATVVWEVSGNNNVENVSPVLKSFVFNKVINNDTVDVVDMNYVRNRNAIDSEFILLKGDSGLKEYMSENFNLIQENDKYILYENN